MDPPLWTRTHGSTFLDLTYGYICTYLESCKQLAIGYGQQLEYFKWSQHTIIGEKLICLIRFDLHLCVSSILFTYDYFTRFNLYFMSNGHCFTVLLLLRKQFILMLIDTTMILTNTINQTNKQILNQNLWIPVMNLTYGSILIKVLRIIIIFLF